MGRLTPPAWFAKLPAHRQSSFTPRKGETFRGELKGLASLSPEGTRNPVTRTSLMRNALRRNMGGTARVVLRDGTVLDGWLSDDRNFWSGGAYSIAMRIEGRKTQKWIPVTDVKAFWADAGRTLFQELGAMFDSAGYDTSEWYDESDPRRARA